MRIALVSKECAPFQGWGAGTYVSLAAHAFAQAGHEVHVLTSDPRAPREGPRLRPGVRFHAVPVSGMPLELAAFAAEPQRYSWAAYLALRSLHERVKFDVIEFPDFLGEAYFALRAKQSLGLFGDALVCIRAHMTVRQIRAINRDDWLDAERATVEHMEGWALAHADAILAPSRQIVQDMRARIPGVARVPSQVLALPIDAAQVRRELGATDRAASSEQDAGITIVYCGRYEYRKGLHTLVAACQRLLDDASTPAFRVLLVGEDTPTGPLRSSYRAWVEGQIHERHRGHFEFRPRLAREQLGKLYAQATCVCVPSIWENFPFACTEAMACGACVVGTDAGGMGDIIEDGVSGVVARADDPESLAHKLRAVINDSSLRARAMGNAPARVEALCAPGAIAQSFQGFVQRLQRGGSDAELDATVAAGRGARSSSGTFSVQASGMPYVSVLVPVYNLHEFLPDTLRSLRRQTFSDFETIVIDDGSTNAATIEAIDALERTADNAALRIVRARHGGLSHARNEGIRAAKGRFILPLDADDMLVDDGLRQLVIAAERNPGASFVTGALRSFDRDPDKPVAGWIPLGGDRTLLPVMNAAASCVGLMRRDWVIEAGLYDEQLPAYEDWDLYCRLVQARGEGVVVPEFLVLHRLRGQSMMHQLSRLRHHLLRARLNAKYPDLSPEPGRTARFMLGDNVSLEQLDRGLGDHASVEQRARELVRQNVRYRLADRLNTMSKSLGVQRLLKRVFGG